MDVDALGGIADGGDGRRLGRDEIEQRRQAVVGAGGKLVARGQPGQARGNLSGHRKT